MITNGRTYILECLGHMDGGNRFLDGGTKNNKVVLSPSTVPRQYPGAEWEAIWHEGDRWQFKCLATEVDFYLNGLTESGRVDLSKNPENTGTYWNVERQAPGLYHLTCLNTLGGKTHLNGDTVENTVDLRDSTKDLSGTNWRFYEYVD